MSHPSSALPVSESLGPKPTSGLAIASLVCGLLHVCGFGSVLAVVFGHLGLGQVRRGERSGRGIAIAGLVLGYLGFFGTVAAWLLLSPSPVAK